MARTMPDPSRTHQVALLVALAAAGAAHALGSPLPSMARPALRGGGGEMEGTSAMQRSVDGVITADEAVTLRGMGLLNGPFQADSEAEPASDVQDAHEAQWPDDWAGEEELGDVMKLTSGPVRLYSSNKYNHEILPTGRVNPDTLARLSTTLADDTAFLHVPIEEDQSDLVSELADSSVDKLDAFRREARAKGDDGVELDESLHAHLAAVRKDGEVYRGIPLGEGVLKEDIDKWLSEAHIADEHKGSRQHDVPSLDLTDVPRCKERIAAETRLDEAIQQNDEEAVEACIDELKRIDEAAGY